MRRILLTTALLAALVSVSPAWALYGAATEKPRPGSDAPRFSAELLEGGEFDLGPLLGTGTVVLDFWSIYCVACVQQLPKLADLSVRYAGKIHVVGINLDSFGTKRVNQFVKGLGYTIPFPIAIDKNRQAAARFGVTELPTTVLIDGRGAVSYYHVGFEPGDEVEIEDNIKKAITKQ